MKVLSIVLLFLIISCEKNTEPIGNGEVYLETDNEIYNTNDSINFFLVNNTNRSIYSHPPGDWALSKKVDEEWEVIYPQLIIMVVLPPREWKGGRKLISTYTLQDTGLYKIQMFLSWDKEAEHREDLGIVFSNTFQIKNGT